MILHRLKLPRELFGEHRGRDGERPPAQAPEHQIGARHVAVVDVAGNDARRQLC
jgi:hypothetical protein